MRSEALQRVIEGTSRFRLLEGLKPTDSIASAMVQRARDRDGLLRLFGGLTDDDVEALVYDTEFWARREQIPPDVFATCLLLAGRGWGKTFAGASWVMKKARTAKAMGGLVGPTVADVRDTMIQGPSGILALSPPWFRPKYEPSKRRLTWPNGMRAICYSADKPDQLRGPNLGWVWGDEPASWRYEMAALDQLPMVLRIGTAARPPQLLLTGTPRPLDKLIALMDRPDTVLRTGSSLANAANLAPQTVALMRSMANTRWGRQEVGGEVLRDVPGAIFAGAQWGRIEGAPHEVRRSLDRCIVALDPAPTSETRADETGIIVEGVKSSLLYGIDGQPLKVVVILKDASIRGSPREWATAAIEAYGEFGCDAIVAEVNSGGEMVTTTIESVAKEIGAQVNVKTVRATSGKSKRAEPVSALAEAGRIALVGEMPKLEKQLEKFTGVNGRRDDRADAMCWGVHELVFADTFWAI